MSRPNRKPRGNGSGQGPASGENAEKNFAARLLAKLAREDSEACDALLKANPSLLDSVEREDDLRERVRAALTGQGDIPLSPQQERVANETRSALARLRDAAAGPDTEPDGILTSMTRQLAPEKAVALYRKITPVFVYQLLGTLERSASLMVVHQIVDHLCSEDVQARLRASEHVRDAILDEFRVVLGQSELGQELSRDSVERLLNDCGAMNDLIAMENCIKLAASRTG